MGDLSEEIRSLALAAGADLVGFAPVERFAGGPEKTHPNYYMPKARSVVSIAIGFPRSIGEVWGTYQEEGTLPGPYMWFGFAYLNWELSRAALKVAKDLGAPRFPQSSPPSGPHLGAVPLLRKL